MKDQYFKDEYYIMFFEIHYEFTYLRNIEKVIRKYKNIYSTILSVCSIVSAISIWIQYYIPSFNFVSVIASLLTVIIIFIVMKSPYSEQLIYLDLFNKEATELINAIKTEKRNVEYKDLAASKIQNLIEKFETQFMRLDILYINPLKLRNSDKVFERCQEKATHENDNYFDKEHKLSKRKIKVERR